MALPIALSAFGSLAIMAVAVGAMEFHDSRRRAKLDAQSPASMSGMRAEQAWLVAQGLAPIRPIGRGEDASDPVEGTPHERRARFLLGWRTSGLAHAYASVFSKPLADWLAQSRTVISPPSDRWAAKWPADSALADMRYVYRHEEGHAQEDEGLATPVAPAPWPLPAKASSIIFSNGDQGMNSARWRERFLSQTRSEAFGDAFALLAASRKGPGAMAEQARLVAVMRLPGALEFAGEAHNVDSASFLAGQLDQAQVAKLSPAGLRSLAELVAAASVDWALARQAPSLGFFDEAGRRWWMELASAGGVQEDAAAREWEGWRAAELADFPDAAFGDRRWTVEGRIFHARGLARGTFDGSQWRFDGAMGLDLDVPGKQGDAGPEAASPRPAGAAPTAGRRELMNLQAARAAAWEMRCMGALARPAMGEARREPFYRLSGGSPEASRGFAAAWAGPAPRWARAKAQGEPAP